MRSKGTEESAELFPLDARAGWDLDAFERCGSRAARTVTQLYNFARGLKNRGLVIDAGATMRGWKMGEVVERSGAPEIRVRLPAVFDAPTSFVPLSQV
jgi:hypothetical protein